MRRHWRLICGTLGLLLVVASAVPFLFPALTAQQAPERVRRVASLPQPKQIIRSREKSFAECVASLWNENEFFRQNFAIRRFGPNRRVNANALCFPVPGRF